MLTCKNAAFYSDILCILSMCVTGVTVLKGQEEIEVRAPVVISNAGIFNTFQKFLPKQVQDTPGKIMLRQQKATIILQLFLNLSHLMVTSMCRDTVTVGHGASWHGFLLGLCRSGWIQRGAWHCLH